MAWYKAFSDRMKGMSGLCYEEGASTTDPLWNPDPADPSGIVFCDTALSPWLTVPPTVKRHIHRVHPWGQVVHVHEHRYKAEGVIVGRRLASEELRSHSDNEMGTGCKDQVLIGNGSQILHVFGQCSAYVSDRCVVYAYEDAVVYASDQCVVEARDRSHIMAGGDCRVYCSRHQGRVMVFGNATVTPWPSTLVDNVDHNPKAIVPPGMFIQARNASENAALSLIEADSPFDNDRSSIAARARRGFAELLQAVPR